MPRNVAQYLKVYVADVSSEEITVLMHPEFLKRMSHSTKIPGGFWRLELALPSREIDYWQWREERLLYRVVLEEAGGRKLWEGRLEDVELVDDLHVVLLGFVGYWSNFADSVQTPSYATTGDAIVKNLRDSIHADTLQLSTSNASIEASGVTVTLDFSADDWSAWRILTDSKRGVLKVGNSSDQKMDLAVWDDREVSYQARNPTSVDWTAYVRESNGGGVSKLPLSVSWRNVANAVTAVYDSGGTLTRTSVAVDSDSISRWIRREVHLSHIGESTSATAVARRNTELALRKDLQQQVDGIELNRVWDADGVEWPLCRVRAGDVLRIPDFVPRTGDLDSLSLDAFRTFVIEETTCDHLAGILSVRPDRDGQSLVDALIRNGVV